VRVAFDATSLLGRRTGIGVCTEQILARLTRPGLEVTAFAVSARGARSLRTVVPPGIGVVKRPMAARPLRAAWRISDHPSLENWTGRFDVVHGPNFVVPPSCRGAEVVTVHDLTCIRFPELCTADTLQIPTLLRRAIARGAWVHTVSQFVADEVAEHFEIAADRVRVIHNGAPSICPESERAALADAGRALAGGADYLLSLGTIEPRKDIPGLIAAFDLVAPTHPGLALVIAGPDGWGAETVRSAIENSPNSSRILRTGWVDDLHRNQLLAGAAAFVYPSIYEGFGLPPLEALAFGTPVVATRVGALPEVLADSVTWADPDDAVDLASAITGVLDDPEAAASRTRVGRERLPHFNWDRSVDSLLELYGDATAERRTIGN
jgi:glycosyltransferase involved in cell wall biosynthesis